MTAVGGYVAFRKETMSTRWLLCVSCLTAWAMSGLTLQVVEPADLVLSGGKIVTLDGQLRVVKALAVRGGITRRRIRCTRKTRCWCSTAII